MRPVNMRLGARIVRSHAAFIVAAMVAGVALHSVALAQPAVTKPPAREPTLDELLGIKPAAPAKPEAQPGAEPAADGAKPSADPSRAALDRDLSDEEVDEAFAQAVALMGQTAARLGGPKTDGKATRDAGLETQRLQEEILRKLDALIDAAEKNAQQSQSKSKQKSQQQQQQDQQRQGQQSSQAQAQQQGQRQGQQSGTEAGGVPGQAAQPGTALGGSAASWGNLPQHVRDALTEGTSDRFSSMYRVMTEEYYKRLAEDRGGTAPRERRP